MIKKNFKSKNKYIFKLSRSSSQTLMGKGWKKWQIIIIQILKNSYFMCFDLYFVLNLLPDAIYTILKTFNQIFTQLKRIKEFHLNKILVFQNFSVTEQCHRISKFNVFAFQSLEFLIFRKQPFHQFSNIFTKKISNTNKTIKELRN